MGNKKNWKRLAVLALSAVMLVPAQSAYATGGQTMEPGMEAYAEGFEIEDGVLKTYTGTATEVVIPEVVTSIGFGAFEDCSSLVRISIPEGVTSIGSCAFAGCSSCLLYTSPSPRD